MKHTTNIIGHVGRDAEMRFTPSGQAVTNFPVAGVLLNSLPLCGLFAFQPNLAVALQ